MVDHHDIEKSRTGTEAREAILRRPRSTSGTGIGDALRRYLAVEHYRRRSDDGKTAQTPPDHDHEA